MLSQSVLETGGAAVRIDGGVGGTLFEPGPRYVNGGFAYDRWIRGTGLPIYHGYYVEDLRAIELGWWDERGCDTAFIQLFGQEGVSEARVSEIPPGGEIAPFRFALDEMIYVLQGRGTTTVEGPGGAARSFEWQKRGLFIIHRGWRQRHFNVSSEEPVRLLHYNYLPIAMSALPDNSVLFNSEAVTPKSLDEAYAAARLAHAPNVPGPPSKTAFWYGDYFPEMGTWDQLENQEERGPGSRVVFLGFPGSEMSAHMAVFPAGRYKRAHRHGPGRAIVIPAGEGFSVLWQEGGEKIIAPWHEASLLTPPNRWFHQHFNVGTSPARYLALHPLRQFSGHSEKVEDKWRDSVDFVDEEPWIRERFESELAKRGGVSLMPPEAYVTPNFGE